MGMDYEVYNGGHQKVKNYYIEKDKRDAERIPRPRERNNVRANTMYEEYHPTVQQIILGRIGLGG